MEIMHISVYEEYQNKGIGKKPVTKGSWMEQINTIELNDDHVFPDDAVLEME